MAQHTHTRLDYAIQDLDLEAQYRALADYLPFLDNPNEKNPMFKFYAACDWHQWRFYADGSAVRDAVQEGK